MLVNQKLFYASLLAAALIALPLTQAIAKPGEKGRRGPPPEAIEACADKSENDSCAFTSPRGDEVTGICLVPPRGEESLACKPEGGPPGGKPPRDDEQ